MKMNRKWKYILAISVAVVLVVGSAVLPPALARKSDRSFLNQVKKDSRVSETYQYKPTKYQKMRVLYQANQQFGWFYTVESWKMVEGIENSIPGVQVEVPEESERDSVLTSSEAKNVAKQALNDLGKQGVFPFYPKNANDIVIESVTFQTVQDLTISNTRFYFWYVWASDTKTGDYYSFMMDDEQGKIYLINCNYSQPDKVILENWNNNTSAKEKAKIFARQHEIEVKGKIAGDSYLGHEMLFYETEDPDYEVMFSMKTNNVMCSMMLKPSDS